MQIKVRNIKLLISKKICSNFFLMTLFLIIFLFKAGNTFVLLITVKFAAILRKIRLLKNPRRRPKWRTCYKRTVAIATVLN